MFCSLFLPKAWKKCILEKTDKVGAKLLLSGGGRCNLTNIHLTPELHYIGQALKSLPSLFHNFGPEDMIQYLSQHGIETVVEDNGRVMLKSGKSKQLVDFLVNESKNNDTDFLFRHEVESIVRSDDHFLVSTSAGEFIAKKVIVASGGITYPQL